MGTSHNLFTQNVAPYIQVEKFKFSMGASLEYVENTSITLTKRSAHQILIK